MFETLFYIMSCLAFVCVCVYVRGLFVFSWNDLLTK